MEAMELIPVRQPTDRAALSIIPVRGSIEAEVQDIDVLSEFQEANVHSSQFIESNTSAVSLSHLRNECVVPVFSKDNEVTVSHINFIEAVLEAAGKVFPRERIGRPEIRVSHIIKGRTPEAINKPVRELLDKDKTIYYERMAFVIEIPTVREDINDNSLTLSIGGVRAYNHENLYSKKTSEKFKVFIGFKNMVCCNMCISTNGYQEEVRAMSSYELQQRIIQMLQLYNIQKHLNLLNSFKNQGLNEHQFAQLIGKSKLYQCLPPKERKLLPSLEFNDSHINIIARSYYKDEAFSRDSSQAISLWNVYNLFTGANKSSYIDTFLSRSVNATDFIYGISEALQGSSGYRWFLE